MTEPIAIIIVKSILIVLTSYVNFLIYRYYRKQERQSRSELAGHLYPVCITRDPHPSSYGGNDPNWIGKEDEDERTQKIIDGGVFWHSDIKSDLKSMEILKFLKLLKRCKNFQIIMWIASVFIIIF